MTYNIWQLFWSSPSYKLLSYPAVTYSVLLLHLVKIFFLVRKYSLFSLCTYRRHPLCLFNFLLRLLFSLIAFCWNEIPSLKMNCWLPPLHQTALRRSISYLLRTLRTILLRWYTSESNKWCIAVIFCDLQPLPCYARAESFCDYTNDFAWGIMLRTCRWR